MTRTRMALTLTTLGLAGLLTLPACGASPDAFAGVAEEAVALQTVGMDTEPSAAPAEKRGPGMRKMLRRNTLHGETTVQGRNGVRTVVVQRGTVTAADATSMTVRSTDGFTLTWTLGDKLRVVQNRAEAERSAVKTGAEVGVAGKKTGDTTTARLVVVR